MSTETMSPPSTNFRVEDIDGRNPLAVALYAWQQRNFWRQRAKDRVPDADADFNTGYATGHIAAYSNILDAILATRDEDRVVEHLRTAKLLAPEARPA